jgi:hypothetical protein
LLNTISSNGMKTHRAPWSRTLQEKNTHWLSIMLSGKYRTEGQMPFGMTLGNNVPP